MSDSFGINLSNCWPLKRALAYVKDLPQPETFSFTWLMEQLPEGVSIEFPRITDTYPDLSSSATETDEPNCPCGWRLPRNCTSTHCWKCGNRLSKTKGEA